MRLVEPAISLLLSLALIGCANTISVPDLAVNPPGCRFPSACYQTDDAGVPLCDRAPVVVCGEGTGVVCPESACPANSICIEAVQVCVGRGPLCPGSGALCVPEGSSCGAATGTPPERVGEEPRCALPSDVCCPGTELDLSANIGEGADAGAH